MTEPFAPQTTNDNSNEQQPNDNTPFVDNTNAGAEGGNSLEDQIKGMEQRMRDKDTFIDTLKNETKEMRETIEALEGRMTNLDEIKKALSDKRDTSNQHTAVDEDTLVGKVIESLSERETKKLQEENYNSVMNTLTEEYGSQYVYDKVKSVADSNGLTITYMEQIAKQSPKAFYNLMGLNIKTSTPQPTHGKVITPTDNNEKGLDYYSKLRRESPLEFQKPEVQRAYRLAILNKE